MPSDAILQLQNRTMTRRLLAYFDARPGAPRRGADDDGNPPLAVWPRGDVCGATASWLGTTGPTGGSARSDGGLMLITGIEASVSEFIEWARGAAPVARALSRLYWYQGGIPKDGACEDVTPFAWPAAGSGGHPLPRAADAAALVASLAARVSTSPRPPLRVMAAPRSLQMALLDALEAINWPTSPTAADVCLAAVDAGDGRGVRATLLPRCAILADTTAERERGDAVSRAAAKLTEVVGVLGVSLASVRGAIDVGAAPGGWTAALADAGVTSVVAVDPAALDAGVLSRPAVTHVRALSDAAGTVDAVRAALRASAGVPTADLLLCDANASPGRTVRALRPLTSLLRPGGLAILTLKCAHGGSPYGDGKAFAARLVREKLEPACLDLVTTLWLVANTLAERTMVLVKRGEGETLLMASED